MVKFVTRNLIRARNFSYTIMTKPHLSEYPSFFDGYIQRVPKGNFLDVLNENTQEIKSFFSSIKKDKQDFRYQPGKWTVKQILLHMTDTERVMSYRALTVSRGDSEAVFPSMDENLFATNAIVGERTIKNLLDEFCTVRKATEFLFENMTDKQSKFSGKVMGQEITARALAFIIVGHTMHHLNVIKERYLKS